MASDQFSDDTGAVLEAPDDDQDIEQDEPEVEAAPPEPSTVAGKVAAANAPKRSPAAGQSRKGRREAFANSTKQVEDRVSKTLNEFSSKFERALEEVRRQNAPRQEPQRQQQPAADPAETEIAEVHVAMEREMELFQVARGAGKTFDLTRYNALRQKEIGIQGRAAVSAALHKMGLTPEAIAQMRQGAVPRQAFSAEMQMEARFTRLQEEFTGVKADSDWKAVGAYRRYLLSVGREDNFETDREAAAHVVAERGLHGPKRARANESRYVAPQGGSRGDATIQGRELQLPRAAVRGLTERERELASKEIFGRNG